MFTLAGTTTIIWTPRYHLNGDPPPPPPEPPPPPPPSEWKDKDDPEKRGDAHRGNPKD